MPVVTLLLTLAAIGFVAWALTGWQPVASKIVAPIRTVIVVAAVVVGAVITLDAFGLLGTNLGNVPRIGSR